MSGPEKNNIVRLGGFGKFCLAAAGANDPIVLDGRVPADAIHREITVGMAMFVTAAFAFVASLASLLMIFENQPWRWFVAPPLALLWATAIFTIDRSLVLSMGRARWAAIVARLLLGALVAVSVSMPIDIALFQDRVKTVLLNKRQDAQVATREKIAQIHDLDGIARNAERLQAELDQVKGDVGNLPADVLELRTSTQTCDTELGRRRQRLEPQIAELGMKIGALETQKLMQRKADSSGDAWQALERERIQWIGRRNAMRTEIRLATNQCEQLRRDARAAEQQHREQAQKRVAEMNSQVAQAREEMAVVTHKVQQDAAKADDVIEESLAENFVAKAEALHHLVWSEPSSAVTYFLILTLWLTMEMAAILAKIMAGKGCIDSLLEAKGQHVVFEETEGLTRRQMTLRTDFELEEVMRQRAVELAREDPAYAQDKLRQELAARNVLAAHREIQRELHTFLDENDRLRERAEHGSGRHISAVGQALGALDRAAAQAVMRALDDSDAAATPA